jgi:septal ring factor EnvC (AmiA/AmiB activator)
MVKNFFLYISLLIILSSCYSFPQDDIAKRKTELQNIREEILNLENEINQQTKEEKRSYTAIEKYNKQSFLLNKLISKLRREEKIKQNEIVENEQSIIELEEQIKLLQKNYSKYVVTAYKYGGTDELVAIFDSESLQQAMIRLKYLKSFSEKREKDLRKFEESKKELVALKQKLERERKEKELLTLEKMKEEAGLEKKLSEKQKVLKTIKSNKTELKKELDAKKSAEGQIQNLIAKLVEEAERKRKEEELARIKKTGDITGSNVKNETSGYDIDLNTSGFESFSNLRGKLNWPVSRGKIIRKFGENRNSTLKTVTLNYGVDIKASGDLSVKSVAGGVISAIDYVPGYGSVIIVTHKEDYRTVYSHLSEIYVSEGDRVKAGSLIAKVGESLEGYILHFEIWDSRVNQNPELWFAKR